MGRKITETPTLAELVSARRSRDDALRGRERPLLKLSWVIRQQRRAAPFVVTLLAVWLGGFLLLGLVLRHPCFGD